MKAQKTLSFMVRNPIPFIVQLICWFLYAVLLVVSTAPSTDESLSGEVAFTDRALPGIVRLAKTSFDTLPGSLENFAIIVSIVFDEVIMEVLTDGGWVFIAVFALIIGYREARGNLKGIAKERQTWMQWYDEQQEVIKQEDTLDEPPSALEDTQANSYFRKAQRTVFSMVRNPMPFVLHFTCWFSPFFFLFLIGLLIGRSHTIPTTEDLAKIVPSLLTFTLIPALISSYQETRGTIKGVAKETQVWTKWYQRQITATAQGYTLAAPPPSLDIF